MKFDIYETYLKEQQLNAEKSEELQRKSLETESAYRALITEYEAAIAHSFETGKDATKALDAMDEKIDKARREMDRAKREYDVYTRIKRDVSITREDIIGEWNRNFNPSYYDKEIAPVLDELKAVKHKYYEAMCAYFDKVYAIKDFREEVSSQLGFEFPYHFHIKELNTTQEFDNYFIRQDDMDKAQMRRR